METSFNNQILFKPHSSGSLGTWRIVVSLLSEQGDEACFISYAAKIIGGKEKETITHIKEGKQKRTPYEQAMAEAESKFKTKLRKGYSVEKPEVGSKAKNTLGLNIAVKAQKWHEVDHKPPYLISPKLDGHHISIGIIDKRAVVYSMNSKELDIEHIRTEAQHMYDCGNWDGTELDGELYRHGWELDQIKSRIKKDHIDHLELQFHMYDIMDHVDNYQDRFLTLETILGQTNKTFQQVKTLQVQTSDEVDFYHAKWLSEGYEGSMIRWGSAGYADSARSKYVLKKKDYQDAEFKVIGWELGKPKFKDGKQYERPVLILTSHNGTEFRCGLHGTMVETNAMYDEGLDKFEGEMYTVKYFKINVSGAPSQPIGLRFRSDI